MSHDALTFLESEPSRKKVWETLVVIILVPQSCPDNNGHYVTDYMLQYYIIWIQIEGTCAPLQLQLKKNCQ